MEAVQTDETLVSLYGDALDFAQKMNEPLTTFHFLLSFFTTPSEVTVLFEDMNITTRSITRSYKTLMNRNTVFDSGLSEPENTIALLEKSVHSFLQNKHDSISSMHFLCAIISERHSIAYKILEHINVLSDIRLNSYSMLSTPMKRVEQRKSDLNKSSTRITPASTEPASETRARIHQMPSQSPDKNGVAGSTEEETTSRQDDVIEKYGRNLTKLTAEGATDTVFGRGRELEKILDILGRKKNNNPLIIGPAGSGKTSIVEGIAQKQRDGLLPGKIIWEIHLPTLLSGTEYRGSLEKRVDEIIRFVQSQNDRLIVFIDEIHLINAKDNEILADMLKPVLSRDDFPLIGATTPEEFKRHIARDPAMERRFSIIEIDEPRGDELYTIVINAAASLSRYHNVVMDDRHTVESAIKLSNRYIAGKHQPDKVLSLLDTVGSVMQRSGKKVVSDSDLLEIVSAQTGIPLDNLFLDGSSILSLLPRHLDRHMTGQAIPKKKVVRLLARRFNRKTAQKPLASFIFAGPTGVGKTEMARRLAQFFFGAEQKMVIFDMSEFQEQHAVSKLIGAPPGYAGYEDGGKLTEAFRRQPYQLLLLDEVEKAHPKVLTILLQLLEEGRITDTRGFSVRLNEAIVVLTTNLGADVFSEKKVGFGSSKSSPGQEYSRVLDKIDGFMSAELLNRVDEVVVFTKFSDDELHAIAKQMLTSVIDELADSLHLTLRTDDPETVAAAVVSLMSARDRSYGARAVRRAVERNIEGRIMEEVYGGTAKKSLTVTVRDGVLHVV